MDWKETETKEWLLQEWKKVEEWEKDQSDLWFWEKIAKIPFTLLDKLIPASIQNAIGKTLDELGAYIQTGGRYLIDPSSILKELENAAQLPPNQLSIQTASQLPLQTMDHVAQKLITSRKQWATLQGATTGFGGIFTLVIDIPALLGLSLKVLQEMALVYGYNPNDYHERIFIVQCLQFAASDYVGKQAILKNLSQYDEQVVNRESISQIKGWREVIQTFRDQYTWKKMLQAFPIVGIIIGAYLNRSLLSDVAETGHMLYRKRRIAKRLKQLDQHSTQLKPFTS